MKQLILHVGPGKCGSSSIQNFFATVSNPCVQKTRYLFLNPLEISGLNCELPEDSLLDSFTDILLNNLAGCDILILSHEFLFQNPYSIKNICTLSKNLGVKTCIVGYSRRQSEFIISAYSQWLFRSPERIGEITDILKEFGLDSLLFTGLEKQIIASVINDFYSARQLSEYSILDWNGSYNNISKLVHDIGAEIKCGVLPDKNSRINLITDFCDKSGLTLRSNLNDDMHKITNRSFNHNIVEAINSAAAIGIEIAGPHEKNEIIELLSSKINTVSGNSSKFMLDLKAYVDSFYWESNKKLCIDYDLDEKYFEPFKRYRKNEIIDIIMVENYQRSLKKSAVIEKYRRLSAEMVELCFKLVEINK